MKTPNRIMLNTVRFSDRARAIIQKAFKSTNSSSALKQLTELLKGKAVVIYEATRYSPSSGKPVRYGWKPFEKWDGRLWLGSHLEPSLDPDEPLYGPLLRFLPKGRTTVVRVRGASFVVRHVREQDEGDLQTGGTTPHHLEFTRAD